MTRRRHRPDNSQDNIVKALRKIGCIVELIGRPVDGLVTHPSWPSNTWRLVEFKTPTKAGKLQLKASQVKQKAFVATHAIPYLTTPEMALEWFKACSTPKS